MRSLLTALFLSSAFLCRAASTEDNNEKLRLALEIKGHNFQSRSQHELQFNEKELIKSVNSSEDNKDIFVELTPKRLSSQKLGDTSSFLVEIKISRREGNKMVSVANPLVSVEYGGQTHVQEKTEDNEDPLEVSVLSLR